MSEDKRIEEMTIQELREADPDTQREALEYIDAEVRRRTLPLLRDLGMAEFARQAFEEARRRRR